MVKKINKSTRKIGKREKVKKEFTNFANKISQLETLRHELEALNTRGFETEVKLIRSKLKNVNAISEIKKEINSLRGKIMHKSSKGIVKSKIARELLEESSNIKEDRQLMKEKITELEKDLSKKKQISNREVKIARELLEKSGDLQRSRQGFLKKRIGELEDKINKKKKKQLSGEEIEDVKDIPKLKSIARRKQLSKEEVKEIRGIPKLEEQLSDLKKDFEEHNKVSKVKIDTGIGVLVDSRYDDFIVGIKAELTEKLEAKERIMDNKLKANLEGQKERFSEQYTNLTDKFHKKYREKIKEELKKDVKEKFKQMLERKLTTERNKITNSLIKENAKKLHDERKKIIAELESNYLTKQNKNKNLLKSKIENVKNERLKLLKKERESSEKIKIIKEKMYAVLVSKLKDIRKESNNRIKEKEEKLKSQFEKKYKEELKKAISIRVNLLEKKKVELEKHLVKHAKKIFD
tara:strand:- start:873 stop:2267 length:1395 start_codon:yes stop_codon:yes gene_type:complete